MNQDSQSKLISGTMNCYPLRLKPGQELQSALLKFVKENNLESAFVLTCVGSITKAKLRMANAKEIKLIEGPFEIVSLVGTLSGGETGHLHISLSDRDGHVIGGHVVSDLTIYTTAEVMIGTCRNVKFTREFDEQTGYDELVISQTGAQQ